MDFVVLRVVVWVLPSPSFQSYSRGNIRDHIQSCYMCSPTVTEWGQCPSHGRGQWVWASAGLEFLTGLYHAKCGLQSPEGKVRAIGNGATLSSTLNLRKVLHKDNKPALGCDCCCYYFCYYYYHHT